MVTRWGDAVVIQVRAGELTSAMLDAIEQALRLERPRMKRPNGILVLLEADAPLPPPDVRRHQKELQQSMLEAKKSFTAIVVLGDGAGAIARRTVIRTVILGNAQARVFDGVPPAARWLAEHVGADAVSLAGAVETTRARCAASRSL